MSSHGALGLLPEILLPTQAWLGGKSNNLVILRLKISVRSEVKTWKYLLFLLPSERADGLSETGRLLDPKGLWKGTVGRELRVPVGLSARG